MVILSLLELSKSEIESVWEEDEVSWEVKREWWGVIENEFTVGVAIFPRNVYQIAQKIGYEQLSSIYIWDNS